LNTLHEVTFMSFASSLARRAGTAFNRQRTRPRRRDEVSRRRPEHKPRLEPLEDRRLLSYTIIELGSLGGTLTVPNALNDRGEVVGYSFTAANGPPHAFLYSKGRMTDLLPFPGTSSEATGINDKGEIVGTTQNAPGTPGLAAFLDHGDKAVDLGALMPDLIGGDVISINHTGAITRLTTRWPDSSIQRGRKNIDLGSLAGMGSVSLDINDRGEVVGISTLADQPIPGSAGHPVEVFHAFRYNRGRMHDLGTLGGAVSYASAINDRGSVVGFSDTANDAAVHAFVDTHGRMTDLGTFGGLESSAAAINNEGVVVDFAQTGTRAAHGFIERHGRMIDLNSLIPANSGIVITDADAINDRGQIAAQGYATSAPSVHLALLLVPARPAK
jgi:probable HAF family extracellular repeat protein